MGIENSDSLKSSPSDTSKKAPTTLKPWSSYTPADYTVAQYHDASLIHNHDGPPTSKEDCKLPIKTPSGMVHPGGVAAAAASLAGARGGVQASASQKADAAKQLVTQYTKLKTEPPPSLKKLAHSIDVEKFIEHHGIKGQKWGIRNPRNRSSAPAHTLSNEEIQAHIKRMELEKRYNELNTSKKSSGKKFAGELLKNATKAAVGTAVSLSVGKALKTALG